MSRKKIDDLHKKNLKTNKVESITKKQHFLSQFLIRNWSFCDSNKKYLYKIFNYKTKEIKIIKLGSDEDIFFDNFFYEQANLEINKIENILSKVETLFSNFVKKIINIKEETSLLISSKEIVLIFVWYYFQNIRTMSWRENKIKLWKEYWESKETDTPDLYLKFYHEINSNIIEIYEKLFVPFQKKKTRINLINYEDYKNWFLSFEKTLIEKQQEINYYVINNIDTEDIDFFSNLWIDYEYTKYNLSFQYLNHFYFFFSFFKPIILKAPKNNNFILADQIFEHTGLNPTFIIHTITLSPDYVLGFISKDMFFNKSTIWPKEFLNFKKEFSFEKILNQIPDISKDSWHKIPIIKLSSSHINFINKNLIKNTTNKNVIIPFNSNEKFLNEISKKSKTQEQIKLFFDYNKHWILVKEDKVLTEKEFKKYLKGIKSMWSHRFLTQHPDIFEKMWNRIRFVLLIEAEDDYLCPPITFGKFDDRWFFNLNPIKQHWKEFIVDFKKCNDMGDLVAYLLIQLKFNLNYLKNITVTDTLLKTKDNNLHRFNWNLNNNSIFLEEITEFTEKHIKIFDENYCNKYFEKVLKD